MDTENITTTAAEVARQKAAAKECAEAPVRFTAEAIDVAKRLLERPEYKGKPLRIYLCGKDCDGFMYGVNFDEKLEGDFSWEQDGVALVIDPSTRDVCVGSTVEFIQDERGVGFLLTNPRQSEYAGKFWRPGGDPDHHHDHDDDHQH